MNPTNKKFTSMFILLVSLFIFVFFTQNIYSTFIEKKEININLKNNYKRETIENDKINRIKKDLKEIKKNDSKNDEIKEIAKYLKDSYSENEILRTFFTYSGDSHEHGQVTISSISLSEGKKNELGFNEAIIKIEAKVPNKKGMIDFLNFIINNPDYKFFILNFSYPENTDSEFKIQIPIKFFYKIKTKVEQNNNKK